ncbi:hypothetical protein V1527DRAFT_449915 [Lipomyces starkeyi]
MSIVATSLTGLIIIMHIQKTDLSAKRQRRAMFSLVRDSSAMNVTYGTHILARDAYDLTYNRDEEIGILAKYIEYLRYRFQIAADNTLESLSICPPDDVAKDVSTVNCC